MRRAVVPRVRVTTGHLVVLAAIAGAAALVGVFATSPELGAVSGGLAAYVGVFIPTMYALIVIHELGHAAAGVALGMRWEALSLTGRGVSVRLVDRGVVRTHAQQVLISIGGLLAGIVAAVLVLALTRAADGSWWSPWAAAALLALGESMVNVLPLGRRTDGARAARSMWHCLRGRSRHPAWQ